MKPGPIIEMWQIEWKEGRRWEEIYIYIYIVGRAELYRRGEAP